ncbi:MAG: M48 family metalloprotease [Pseudomonadota bacterium]
MEKSGFDALITRLEQEARERPGRYAFQVAMIALFGFVILGVALGFSFLVIGLVGGAIWLGLKFGGAAVALLLAKLGKALFLLLIPAWFMLRSTWTMLTTRFPRPVGRAVTREEAPALFARLDDMRARMQGPRFHHVLLTDELNAAVVQHPRFGLFGWEENYLILGMPLLQVLDADEAMAVVAHEYGHLAGQHGRFGAFIYRLRGAWGRMQEISESWTDWGSRLVARMFRWYAPWFNAYSFVLARSNEYEADRSAVELVGRQHAASALTRVNIAAQFEGEHFWPSINRRVRSEREPPAQRSHAWLAAWRNELSPERQRDFLAAALQRITDHADTHPALTDRLRAMGVDPATVAPPAPASEPAALAWFGRNLLAVQQQLDREWREQVGNHWQQRHDYLQERAQRLAELAALPAPSVDEDWESLSITGELEPDADLLPRLDALLARAPEHASALFRRGQLRLERGDEKGIDDLEKVMGLDADATLPACSLIFGHLSSRNDERAADYEQRWLARNAFETRRQAELDTVDPKTAELTGHDLEASVLEECRRLLQDNADGIKRAWLLRRVIASDPDARAWLIAVETGMFTGSGGQQKIVTRLAELPWPLPLHIVPLSSDTFAPLRKKVKKLAFPPLYAAS